MLLRILAKIIDDGECWVWTGAKTGGSYGGYGQINISGRIEYSHRVVFETYLGNIQDGLELDHLCRNHACCNPLHLEPVTHRENHLRGRTGHVNRDKTHCLRGHEFTVANTKVRPDGRECRACIALRHTGAA